MTFVETGVFALEYMIFVLLIKCIASTKFLYNIIKKSKIKTTLLHELVVPFVRGSELNNVHHQSSVSRAAFSSDILLYPLTSGSLDIIRASAIASRVSLLYFGISTGKGSPPLRMH